MEVGLRTPGFRRLGLLVSATTAIVMAIGPSGDRADAAQAGVSITDNAYTPAQISVAAGDTVVWTDNGNNSHSVTSDTAGVFDSNPGCTTSGRCLSKGQTFSQVFNTVGTFAYHCRIHGAAGGAGMSGVVTVTSVGAVTTTTLPTATTTTVARTVLPGPTTTSAPAAGGNLQQQAPGQSQSQQGGGQSQQQQQGSAAPQQQQQGSSGQTQTQGNGPIATPLPTVPTTRPASHPQLQSGPALNGGQQLGGQQQQQRQSGQQQQQQQGTRLIASSPTAPRGSDRSPSPARLLAASLLCGVVVAGFVRRRLTSSNH